MKKLIILLIIFIASYGNIFSMDEEKIVPIIRGDDVTINGKAYEVFYLGKELVKVPQTPEERNRWLANPTNPCAQEIRSWLSEELKKPKKSQLSKCLGSMITSHPIKILGITAIVGFSAYYLRNHIKNIAQYTSKLNKLFYRTINPIFLTKKN